MTNGWAIPEFISFNSKQQNKCTAKSTKKVCPEYKKKKKKKKRSTKEITREQQLVVPKLTFQRTKTKFIRRNLKIESNKIFLEGKKKKKTCMCQNQTEQREEKKMKTLWTHIRNTDK